MWEELEPEALSYGVTPEQYWGDYTPTQIGELIRHRKQKEYELAYYQAMVTAQATWSKEKPKPPILHKPQQTQSEQSEEEMLLNWKSIRAKNS